MGITVWIFILPFPNR